MLYIQKQGALIVPLWNWNYQRGYHGDTRPRFNCTFMELKCQICIFLLLPFLGFNCTFMELKFGIDDDIEVPSTALIVPLWNWNLRLWRGRPSLSRALIVPLWNWNDVIRSWDTTLPTALIVPLWNWNWWASQARRPQSRALIVPLWNWNELPPFPHRPVVQALIVPLWNWNIYDRVYYDFVFCFNCTFMELK